MYAVLIAEILELDKNKDYVYEIVPPLIFQKLHLFNFKHFLNANVKTYCVTNS